ncbi:translation initiation factor 2 [Metasolibacillus meyeri]|uniref:Translation initiation factor 2 n=1 Tax=Metasolibacillus meyeri TaxID=1071052 RepID=A0AAW9NLP9_9BACL|nr:translation initiation factor 2 [Metasolibacillus meyeri]MEC1177447.1 translation initiation factor 2 [Metasolibacillus meyeri]
MTSKEKKTGQSAESTDIQIDRLAYLGTVITVLGYALSAIAEGLELKALEQQKEENFSSSELTKLHEQMDELTKEVRQLRRMLR